MVVGSYDPIALSPIDGFNDVEAAHSGGSLTGWTPSGQLAPGEYHLLGAFGDVGPGRTFFVDPEVIEPPPQLEDANFRVVIDDPDEDESLSCSGFGSTCDDIDFSSLTIDFNAPDSVAGALIRLEFPGKARSTTRFGGGILDSATATSSGTFQRTHLFRNDSSLPASFKTSRVCVTLSPVSNSGAIGTPVDLGCARADDDDPRVVDTRACGASPKSSDIVWVVLSVAILWVRRSTAYSRAC